jgi:hypothetical protein
MMRNLLGGALMIAAFCAVLGVLGYSSSTVSQAQGCKKTINGKNVATESGTLVCDCTVAGTSCACVVSTDCPPGGDGFDIEGGGSQ